ncbi:DNA polymerase V family protein [Dasania sp. GY-MA-18]|uniref:DNA polymerase V family protein n=1 Tax=Dasania phycosphaerae TaxID=2950436 RepID=A0A9J6RHD7_9GAMM|nr:MULTISPECIES: DNA polymerase V family protein [Dasania]MCR8921440.1 DNA polymerase V family protein [Dasania sp. GY-MA-18]MCZ0863868.1 DNA polymerase V family protein [Dasania phycosphaerae]MCZ0867596.1 DNA polymerase V family protein [Dasania phycosphaerae]
MSYNVSISGTTATITLSGGSLSATNTETLVDGISYQNTSNDPTAGNRVVTLTSLKDNGGTANGGDDTAALSIASTVAVVAVNDEPTFTATGSNPTFTEGGAAQNLFSGTSVDVIESGQVLGELTLTISNVNNGSAEILNIDGTAIALINSSGTTASNGLSYSVSVSGTTVTVTLSGGSLSAAATETLVDGISYQNNSEAPNTSNRVVTISSFKDNGGTANGGDDTVALGIRSTVAVQAVNDVPTGNVSIAGSVVEDQTLTANTSTLADKDGLGTYSYQWLRNGVAISGATSATYTLGDADVGKTIRVAVSYTDGSGNAESVSSAATAAVANIDDPLVGNVTIDGTAFVGTTLSANTSGLSDDDGLASFSYQWLRDGAVIDGATASSYLLTSDDSDSDISVRVTATDSYGASAAKTSASVAVEEVFVVITDPSVVEPELPVPEAIDDDAEEDSAEEDNSTDEDSEAETDADEIAAFIAQENEDDDIDDGQFDNLNTLEIDSLTGFGNELGDGDSSSTTANTSNINVRLLNNNSALASAVEASVSGSVDTGFSSFVDPLVLVSSQNLSDSLDTMRETFVSNIERNQSILGGTVTATASLSVGYVVWLIRSGVLLSSALSALPAWRFIDPLPILSQGKGGLAGGDEETLESIVANDSGAADAEPVPQTDNNKKPSH